jgi:hypothetical protein
MFAILTFCQHWYCLSLLGLVRSVQFVVSLWEAWEIVGWYVDHGGG